jgi:hypothetical protein
MGPLHGAGVHSCLQNQITRNESTTITSYWRGTHRDAATRKKSHRCNRNGSRSRRRRWSRCWRRRRREGFDSRAAAGCHWAGVRLRGWGGGVGVKEEVSKRRGRVVSLEMSTARLTATPSAAPPHAGYKATDASHACTKPYRLQQAFLEGIERSDGDGSTGHVRCTEQDRKTGHQHTSAQHPAGR